MSLWKLSKFSSQKFSFNSSPWKILCHERNLLIVISQDDDTEKEKILKIEIHKQQVVFTLYRLTPQQFSARSNSCNFHLPKKYFLVYYEHFSRRSGFFDKARHEKNLWVLSRMVGGVHKCLKKNFKVYLHTVADI